MKLEKNFKVLIVTGLSGAGRSSALKIFEDMGLRQSIIFQHIY
tara:strand:- start:209 stop:337 length:129 start_codon:yes stop_codon:yes gene_type:complete